jgi:hypothetical protein
MLAVPMESFCKLAFGLPWLSVLADTNQPEISGQPATYLMKSISLVAFCALALAMGAPAQDYAIQMHRPAKAGQRYGLEVVARDVTDMVINADGKKVNGQNKDLNVEYKAEVTIVEVGANGKPMKESHQVGNLVKITGAARETVLEAGTVVIAARSGKKTTFEVKGAPVEKEVNNALSLVIEASNGDGPTDDEVFGVRERKKVGDSWPLNREVFEKFLLQDADMKVTDTTGKFTLKETVKETGGQALVIEGTIKSTVNVPVPPGLTSKESAMSATVTGVFPVNPALPRSRESSEMAMRLLAVGTPQAGGPEVEFKVTSKRTITRKVSVLK